jgi:DNA polymerase-1
LFTEIEYDGLYLDMTKFEEAERYLRKEFATAKKNLSKWEPRVKYDKKGKPIEFNWGSPTQLVKLLYEDMGLPVIQRTPTGNPSCNESVLLRTDHPLVRDLLDYRAAKQQLSFFIEGWEPYIHEKYVKGEYRQYLHPSFKLHGTVTGRLSSEHPNAQQIPRDPRIRSLISAEPGWTLIEWDLSQIELRIAAHLANERRMKHAFMNGIDLHWATALREIERGGAQKELVLDTARKYTGDNKLTYSDSIEVLIKIGAGKAEEIRVEWKELRKKAKAINFGYIFGMWWKKFKMYARDNYGVEVTDQQAKDSRVFFFSEYSDLPDWHNKQRRFARQNGYVISLSGRKRRLPKAQSIEDSPERREAERQSINSPVQSFASEINLMCAIQLRREYDRSIVKMCATVHDSVLARVRNDMVPQVGKRMLEIMRKPELFKTFNINLSVPIEAECKVGPWGAGISLEKWETQNATLYH